MPVGPVCPCNDFHHYFVNKLQLQSALNVDDIFVMMHKMWVHSGLLINVGFFSINFYLQFLDEGYEHVTFTTMQ